MAKKSKEKSKVNKKEESYEQDTNVGLFIFGHKFDAGLLIIVLILLAVGLIMMMSASAPYSYIHGMFSLMVIMTYKQL